MDKNNNTEESDINRDEHITNPITSTSLTDIILNCYDKCKKETRKKEARQTIKIVIGLSFILLIIFPFYTAAGIVLLLVSGIGGSHWFRKIEKADIAKVQNAEKSLIDSLRTRFKSDFVDNKEYIENLNSAFSVYLTDEISNCYDSINQIQNIDRFFDNLQSIYIKLWLEETGYGDKLALKMKQLSYEDDYGDISRVECDKELNSFLLSRIDILESYFKSSIPEIYQTYAYTYEVDNIFYELEGNENQIDSIFYKIAIDLVSFYEPKLNATYFSSNLDDVEDPYEYEKEISEELISHGWSSHTTAGSGDQGADVIAEKNGVKLIVQCKLYSSPVGNKAVQEVSAAKSFYNGNIAVVITNNEFTKSAKQLASSLDVHLIHHSQIHMLDELVGYNIPQQT